MAKKAPAAPAKKVPAKRKPRPKKPPAPVLPDGQYNSVVWNPELQLYVVQPKQPVKPAEPAVPIIDPTDYGTPVVFPSWLTGGLKAIVLLTIGALAGIYAAGGIEIGGDVRPGPADAVSVVFDTQESAFRKWSGERAKALRAGEITSEKASADWMAAKYLPESDAAWATLLTAEAAEFGGEKWTAGKEAAVIERYVQ
jgi:hypothetical protein